MDRCSRCVVRFHRTDDGEDIEISHGVSVEPSPWLDPRTGRTEIGSITLVTTDRSEAARIGMTMRGDLTIEYRSGSDRVIGFGPVEVVYHFPSLSATGMTRYTIVFEPLGRRGDHA